ncbi:MAG: LytTR family DNA-binding domain-containing protein [Acidobacteria bacterium]|nr:LytTR family DNA-binding domain-containing protein [Acidobacteriota bacterium]
MRVLIVDDERIARNRIRSLLEGEPNVQVLGECSNGYEAVEYLRQHETDVVFLDVQMPGVGGFTMLKNLPPSRVPLVVFVTAYDKYALQAFEVRAFDYLLKPFDRERLALTIKHVEAELARGRERQTQGRVTAMASTVERRPETNRLAVRNKGHVFFLNSETIDWVEAADNYVCLHCGASTHVMRETMNALESRLSPTRFVRIHRSVIVNTERIRELQPWFRGDYRVVLQDGKVLTLSRYYRDRVKKRLLDG